MADSRPPAEGHVPNPPGKARLLALTAGAVVLGVLVVFGAILPAEYHQDPLGIGKATGLSRLWAPPQVEIGSSAGAQPLAREYPAPFRTDTFDIPLKSGDDPERGNELEFKVRMKKGQSFVYSWTVSGIENPEEFYYDFHGHTLAPAPGGEITVSTHKQATGTSGNGALTAPFDGIQGWYLQNQSLKPVTVRLRLAGFYDLIPAGEEGNLNGIQPLAAPAG